MYDNPYVVRITGTTNAGTAVTLAAEKMLPGQMAEVKHVALANNSGEAVAVQLGIVLNGTFTPIAAKVASVADADATSLVTDFIVREGEALAAQVTGAANKSKVTLLASGDFYTAAMIANRRDPDSKS